MKVPKWLPDMGAVVATLTVISVGIALLGAALFAPFARPTQAETSPPTLSYSLTPIPINQELYQRAATMGFLDAPNPEPRFWFSNSSDLAAIAMGRIRAHHLLDVDPCFRETFTDAVPTEPLFVESYDKYADDYYIIPFAKNGRLTGIVLLAIEDGQAHMGMVSTEVAGPYQPLPIMKEQAQALLRQTRNLKSIPDPRLVFKPCKEIGGHLYPAWEFDLGNEKVYVGQRGRVFTAFERPEKLGGSCSNPPTPSGTV